MIKKIPRDRIVRVYFNLDTSDGHVSYVENDWKTYYKYDRVTMFPNLIKALRKSGLTKLKAEWEDGSDDGVEAHVSVTDAIKWLEDIKYKRISDNLPDLPESIVEAINYILEGHTVDNAISGLLEASRWERFRRQFKSAEEIKRITAAQAKQALRWGAKGSAVGAGLGAVYGGLTTKRDKRKKKSHQLKQTLKGAARGALSGAKHGALIAAPVGAFKVPAA